MTDLPLHNSRVLITGGTGSLGGRLLQHLLTGALGQPSQIRILSRDEEKHQRLRLRWGASLSPFGRLYGVPVESMIGDLRNPETTLGAVTGMDAVFHIAAMKHVPLCEYAPFEATMTNVVATHNLLTSIRTLENPPRLFVTVSTDKACAPASVMGMTKAIQERLVVLANLSSPRTRHVVVRCGNVIGTRGSFVPLFKEQIASGGPVRVTSPEMTRFLLTSSQVNQALVEAILHATPGQIIAWNAPAAKLIDIVQILAAGKDIPIVISQPRTGEKLHELMVTEEESGRTFRRGNFLVINPGYPELVLDGNEEPVGKSISSRDRVLSLSDLSHLLDQS